MSISNNTFTQPLVSIVTNWTLVIQFAKRELVAEHRGSFLGNFWLIAQPLLLMSVYTFVFSQIYNGSYGIIDNETNIHYAIGIFIGITVLHLFNDTLASSSQSISSNPNFVKKVIFPLEILPISIVMRNLYKFSVSFILIFLAIGFLLKNIPLTALWFPIIIISSVLFSMGIAWLLSAVGVYFRDISPLIQIGSLCMLWLSGVFYSARDIPPVAWNFLKYNPVLLNIEMTRDILLWGISPNLVWLTYSFVSSLLTFFIGYWIFRILKPTFADVL